MIREKRKLSEQNLYDPHQSTIDRRMYKNALKADKNILKYPSQREIDHEVMRINTLWLKRPAQYELRLTKITNPQKMYNAYVSIMAWLKINPEYRKNMEKILDKVRWYLRKNGYEDMLVGKGGNVPINLRESRLRSLIKRLINEQTSENIVVEFSGDYWSDSEAELRQDAYRIQHEIGGKLEEVEFNSGGYDGPSGGTNSPSRRRATGYIKITTSKNKNNVISSLKRLDSQWRKIDQENDFNGDWGFTVDGRDIS